MPVFWPLVIPPAGLYARKPFPLQALVTPSTVIRKDGVPVRFAVHGFIEFSSLAELFPLHRIANPALEAEVAVSTTLPAES